MNQAKSVVRVHSLNGLWYLHDQLKSREQVLLEGNDDIPPHWYVLQKGEELFFCLGVWDYENHCWQLTERTHWRNWHYDHLRQQFRRPPIKWRR